MVTDLELRRLGIAAGNPAARKLLALTLGDACSVEAVEWLLVAVTREIGPADAAAAAAAAAAASTVDAYEASTSAAIAASVRAVACWTRLGGALCDAIDAELKVTL